MIKLTTEIKGDKFLFNYQVGESTCGGEENISPEKLVVFISMLEQCHKIVTWQSKQTDKKWIAKAWIETNLDEAKEFIQKREAKVWKAMAESFNEVLNFELPWLRATIQKLLDENPKRNWVVEPNVNAWASIMEINDVLKQFDALKGEK